ncbi:MAG: efflux RND transporter periplasmic adaptor subunit [Myxococcales bacterium]
MGETRGKQATRAARFALLLALIGAAACEPGASADGKPASPDAKGAAQKRPTVVATALVERRDVPIDLEGLGSVTAYKTVTVRSQVDGVLQKVFYTEGQRVKAGEVLAQIDPRPYLIQLQQAEGNLKRDEALLTSTSLDVARYEKLTGQKYLARQQLDETRGLLGQYEGNVQVDRAQVASARLNLSYARIASPIDGVTGVRIVDPGNFVRATDTGGIVVLTQLDPIAVLFTLPQDDLPRIAQEMGGKEPLQVDALDRDGKTVLATGKLLVIDNQINQTTATIRLKALFDNAQQKLWPNQFVKARLHVSVEPQALLVPTVAVQRGPQGLFVYVVRPDHTVEARPLEVGLALGAVTLVKSGVREGEEVVIEGQNQLRPDAKVEPRQASDKPSPPTRSDAGPPPDRQPPGPDAGPARKSP